MLEVCELICSKWDRIFFEGFLLVVEFGELLYLCGFNGVGKISLLCILIGLSLFDLGVVLYNGMDILVDKIGYY